MYNQVVAHIQTALMHRRDQPVAGGHRGQGMIQGMLTRQAAIQAYTDVFQILGLISLALVPFMFLLKRTGSGAGETPALH